jgi:hypothetical protein
MSVDRSKGISGASISLELSVEGVRGVSISLE